MAGNQTRPSNVSKPRNWIPKLLVTSLIGFFVLIFYYNTTLVKGIEFNPGTWQIRGFRFRADPFSGFQFQGIQYDGQIASVDPAITALLDRKIRRENDRWELASISQFATEQTGPSMGMVQLISGYGLGRGHEAIDFWSKWTASQPNKAKVFWPAIHELVVAGRYDDIPALIHLPSTEADDLLFTEKLVGIMDSLMNPRPQSTESARETKPKAGPSINDQDK